MKDPSSRLSICVWQFVHFCVCLSAILWLCPLFRFQEFFSGIADRHFFTFLLEVRVPSNFKTDGAIFLEKILVLEFLIRKGSKWAQNEVFKFYEMSTHRNCLNFCKKVLQHKALKLIFSDF